MKLRRHLLVKMREGITLERFEKKCFALRTINIKFCLLYKMITNELVHHDEQHICMSQTK